MEWNCKPTAGHDTHGQSAVYDTKTGKNIAIVYDGKKHGPMIAAAPDMLRELANMAALWQAMGDMNRADEIGDFLTNNYDEIDSALAAIARAKGEPSREAT